MPKRRRAALGMPKPKKNVRKESESRADSSEFEYGIPTKRDYQRMHPYSSFAVKDDDDEAHFFRVGNNALIVPEGCNPEDRLELHKHWVGKILEIRARDKDPSEVWVRVQWYWAASQISSKLKGKLPLGRMELLHSKSEDFVHSTCFQGLADVVSFDEDSVTQQYIDGETFYWRFEYDPAKERISPKTKLKASCLCKLPYNPDDDDIMHFCISCQKSYHESCLDKHGSIENESRNSDDLPRDIRFERILGVRYPKQLTSFSESDYSSLPQDLLRLARSPIVRGGPEHGVAGNVFPIVQARIYIHDALLEHKPIPDNWKDEVSANLSVVQAWIAEDNDYLCPNCHEVI
ncbi:hypothetical protein SCHPADRAFT_924828 [Schizopora paradoxa]|uniref:BAH domain-containing protein n=1 Tax=Schizopora paradoxa TaxID=27342 RepID=A0A0H2SB97_9AGAM|nr:hypothetical protein SCHPADRAFT_924828 [Schizopora paradoxa]